MQILGFHIDGFGIYHNQRVQDLPFGLVVFVGDNESGKTTLMEFIRTVLFGKRQRSPNDYPPLRGGGHGGRLELRMSDGRRVMVERSGKYATIAVNGAPPQQGEPALLLLGGLDRTTFEHIFAIGLEELQGLKVLDQEGVRGRLFAAGAGLGAASLPAALKSIDEELANLWSPKGKKPRLNLIMDRLREVEREIKHLQGQATAYAADQRRKEELEARAREERAEMENLRFRRRRLEQLQQAREPWAVKLTSSQRAGELAAAKDFPPYGLERLEQLQKDLEEIRRSLHELEGEAATWQERLEQILPDEALLRHREQIEMLWGEREKIAASLAGLPSLSQSLGQAREEYRRRLQDLGPDWDAHRLAQVDTSVAVRLQVQELGGRLERAERLLEQRQAQEENLIRELEDAQRKVQETTRALAELPDLPFPAIEEIRHRQETLGLLRRLFHQRELLDLKLQDRRQHREETEAGLAFLKQHSDRLYGIPWWAFPILAVAGFVLDVVLSTYGYYRAGHLFFFFFLLVTGLLFIGQWHLRSKEQARRFLVEAEVADREKKVQSLAEEISELEAQVAALTQEIARQSRVVSPEPLPDLAALERLQQDLQQAEEQWHNRRTWETKREEAEERLRDCRKRLEKAREEAGQAASELHRLQDEWTGWLTARGLPPHVRPAAFEALLQAVERAREAGARVAEVSRRLAETENYVEAARRRLGDLLAACGRSPRAALPGVEDLERLRQDLTQALELEKEKRELELRLITARKQVNHWRDRLQEKEAELQRLLAQAGASDEDDFRRRAALYHEYQDCLERVKQSEIALLNIAGNPEALPELQEELNRTDPLALQEEKEQVEERLRDLEESVSRTDQEVGSLGLKLSEMARDEQLGNLLQEQSILEEQLQEALKRWATLVISRHLVETARGIYERERQPEVIREAGRFLELMTGGPRRLLAVPGEPGLQVEDPSLRRKDEPRWSAGLADQVYLSVRLGLAREFSRHAEPLPVILDDVLVKFDPRRRRGAARVILEFARQQQVLLFTCHPEFQMIIANLHREDYFQRTPVAYFRIADGTIQPMEPGVSA